MEQEQLSLSSSTLYPNIASAVSGIENTPMREKNEQDAVSQSINDELTKVMKLLKSPRLKEQVVTEDIMEEEEMSGQNDDVSRESTIIPFKMDATAAAAAIAQPTPFFIELRSASTGTPATEGMNIKNIIIPRSNCSVMDLFEKVVATATMAL